MVLELKIAGAASLQKDNRDVNNGQSELNQIANGYKPAAQKSGANKFGPLLLKNKDDSLNSSKLNPIKGINVSASTDQQQQH